MEHLGLVKELCLFSLMSDPAEIGMPDKFSNADMIMFL
jgi:hypothetical protein